MPTRDFYLAVVILLVAIVSFITTLSYPYQSAYFPRYIVVLLGFLGGVILVREIRKGLKTAPVESKPGTETGAGVPFFRQPAVVKVALMICSAVIYLLAVDRLGFFESTLLYLPLMIWALGVRKVRTIVLAPLLVVFFIYLIFAVFLRVPFPEGILL